MRWEEALEEIKSLEFDVRLNMVSGFRLFFKAARQEHSVQMLLQALRSSGEAKEEVLGQLHDMATLEIDPRYQNPHDTALAILLWLTYFAAHEYQVYAAELVLRAPQCWYADRLARGLLNPSPTRSGDYSEDEFNMGSVAYKSVGSVPGTIGLYWNPETVPVYDQDKAVLPSAIGSTTSHLDTTIGKLE